MDFVFKKVSGTNSPPHPSTLHAFTAIEIMRYLRNMSIEDVSFIHEDGVERVTSPETFSP
jgi:hypothetical protein